MATYLRTCCRCGCKQLFPEDPGPVDIVCPACREKEEPNDLDKAS